MIDRLGPMLADCDPSAGDLAVTLSRLLTATPVAAAAAQAARHADCFDFDEAVTALDRLRETFETWSRP